TQLTPRMTVLQMLGWLGYLLIVIPAFLRSSRQSRALARNTQDNVDNDSRSSGFSRLIARRPLAVAAVLVAVPAVWAATVIALLPGSKEAATRVTVTATSCADDWATVRPGSQIFTVVNKSGKTGEINLVDAGNGVVAEIETLGPSTSAPMSATLT